MHMADALLAPAVAATMYAASAVTVGASVKTLRKDETTAKLPTMAVTSALVFAGQMINYTIPGTGSSGHLCGGMMLTALLGPQAGFLSMVVILAIQALFFADGGLLALGANCWNMAFYGCFVGYYLLWRPIMRSKLFGAFRGAARADYPGFHPWMRADLAAGLLLRGSGNHRFRHHRAALRRLRGHHAAHPSGHRSGGRPDHLRRSGVRL